jgi:hypothetical protein
MDVRPWSAENNIDPDTDEQFPIVVMGSATFDASQIDVSSMHIGPDRATPTGPTLITYMDGDAYYDMATIVETQGSGIACDDTDLMALGETFTGETFVGSSPIVTPACETSSCHP